MSDDPKAVRVGGFQFFPRIASEDDARRILRRHWGGWLFSAANALTAVLVWASVPGQPDYSGYQPVAAAYFTGVAMLSAGLTWLVVRRLSAAAAVVLLGLVGLAVVQSFLAALNEAAPPAGPYLFIRLWIALGLLNAMRACRALRESAAHSSPGRVARAAQESPFLRPRGRLQIHRWQRMSLFASFVWIVGLAFWILLFDPDAGLVDSRPWKIGVLVLGPPVFLVSGTWAFRKFVLEEAATSTVLRPEELPSVPNMAQHRGRNIFPASALVGLAAIFLVLATGGVVFFVAERDKAARDEVAIEASADALSEGFDGSTNRRPSAGNPMGQLPPAPVEPVPVLPNLDVLFEFEDPSRCRFGPELQSLFDSMTIYVGDAWVPGRPFRTENYADVLSPTYHRDEDGRVITTLPMSGTWLGLRVSRLYQETLFHPYFEIRFLESPDTVRQVLNRAGFGLPPAGQRRISSGADEMSESQGVFALPGGSALSCASG